MDVTGIVCSAFAAVGAALLGAGAALTTGILLAFESVLVAEDVLLSELSIVNLRPTTAEGVAMFAKMIATKTIPAMALPPEIMIVRPFADFNAVCNLFFTFSNNNFIICFFTPFYSTLPWASTVKWYLATAVLSWAVN